MKIRVVDAWQTTADDGYRESMPIVHVVGRTTEWERVHIEVDEFRPYFLVTADEWEQHGADVADDDRVLDVSRTDRRGRPETAIDGTPLFRVTVREPSAVPPLRDVFDNPYEADVQYDTRFLIDCDVSQWMDVPERAVTERLSVDEVSIGVDEIPDQTPPLRVCTYDIEVQQGGSGPPVVSTEGCEQTRNPITAISAHDSYTDEYRVWVLYHDSWDATDTEALRDSVDCEVTILSNPRDMVGQFVEWVTDRNMDALIGWNASGFDHPYLVNWALQNGVANIYELSPTGDVYDMDGDGNWINSSLKGRLLLDLMDMYEKTQIHSLDSKRLEDIAEVEGVSVGKLDIADEIDVPRDRPAIDYARRHHPAVFTAYAVRDTKTAVAINQESQTEVHIL